MTNLAHASAGAPLLQQRVSLRARVPRMAAIAGLTLGAAACEAAVIVATVPLGLAIANGEAHISVRGVEIAVGTLIALGALAVIVRLCLLFAKAWLSARLVSSFEAELRDETVSAFLQADWEAKSGESASQLHNLLTTNVTHSVGLLSQSVTVISATANLAMLLGAAFIVNPLYAAGVTLIGVALFFGLRPLTKRSRLDSRRTIKGLGEVTGKSAQAVALGREVQIYGVGARFRSYISSSIDLVRRMRFRIQLFQHLVAALYTTSVFLLVFAGLFVIWFTGLDDIVALGAIVLLLLRSALYGQILQSSLHSVGTVRPFWEQVRDRLTRLHAAQRTGGTRTLDQFESLGLYDVSFRYEARRDTSDATADANGNGGGDAQQPVHELVLEHASLRIARGEVIALVGPSGIGKTTLIHLLLGLRQPHAGRVLVNESIPLGELHLELQARLAAFVSQEPVLLDTSVAENIRFFREEIDQAAIEEAARLAHVHDEIASLPAGYASPCGDRGDRFSGGQRQRICIARALAGKPGLLVLDEPTSALDAHSEEAVHASIANMRDRGEVGVLVISHREATMRITDRVVTLEKGRVVEASSGSIAQD